MASSKIGSSAWVFAQFFRDNPICGAAWSEGVDSVEGMVFWLSLYATRMHGSVVRHGTGEGYPYIIKVAMGLDFGARVRVFSTRPNNRGVVDLVTVSSFNSAYAAMEWVKEVFHE